MKKLMIQRILARCAGFFFFCAVFCVIALFLTPCPATAQTPALTQQQKSVLENMFRTASAYQRMGRHEDALKILRQLTVQDPADQKYTTGVEDNLLALKRFDELVALLKARTAHSRDLNGLAKLGDVYYQWGKRAVADSIWDAVIQVAPESRIPYLVVHNYLFKHRLIDEALALLQTGRLVLRDDTLFEYELARLHTWNKDFRRGTTEYLSILRRNPKAYSAIEREILAFAVDSLRLSIVASVINASQAVADSSNPQLVRLLTSLYVRNRDFTSALREYHNLERATDARGKELLEFAQLTTREGAFAVSVAAFDAALTAGVAGGDLSATRYGRAFALESWGRADGDFARLETAITAYWTLIEDEPAGLRTAAAYFRVGEIYYSLLFDLDSAMETFSMAVQLLPDHPTGWQAAIRLGDCQLARGDLAAARVLYEVAAGIQHDKNPQVAIFRDRARFQLARTYYFNEDLNHAREFLVDLLGSVDVRRDLYNDLLDFQILLDVMPDLETPGVRAYMQAEWLHLQRKDGEAIAALDAALQGGAGGELAPYLQFFQGSLHRELDDLEPAIAIWAALVARYPETAKAELAQLQIGIVYEEELMDVRRAATAYEHILVHYPGSLYVDEARTRLRRLESAYLP